MSDCIGNFSGHCLPRSICMAQGASIGLHSQPATTDFAALKACYLLRPRLRFCCPAVLLIPHITRIQAILIESQHFHKAVILLLAKFLSACHGHRRELVGVAQPANVANACMDRMWPHISIMKVPHLKKFGFGQDHPWATPRSPRLRCCDCNIGVPSYVPVHICLNSVKHRFVRIDVEKLVGRLARIAHRFVVLAQELHTCFRN
jgi:hypothetical protein